MLYPYLSAELVELGKQDQAEIRTRSQKLQRSSELQQAALEAELLTHCHERAARALEILATIGQPTIANIGMEGSEAMSLLVLHSYLDEMKLALAAYKKAYANEPASVYAESIPSLTDRVMIFKERQQLYGNNWMVDSNGNYFLIPVKDFEHMNERRAAFGIGPRMKPTIYATGETKHPLGEGFAEANDQKEMTDEEYACFTKGHIR